MAEGEKQEKRVVEMNIWFIILLLFVIIASAWIITLSTKYADLEKNYAELQTQCDTLRSTASERAQIIKEVVAQKADGEISDKQLINRLQSALDEKDRIIDSLVNPPVVEDSGETE